MLVMQIDAVAAQQAIVYEAARKIRALLDAAREEYGADEWDGGSVTTEVLELVTEPE